MRRLSFLIVIGYIAGSFAVGGVANATHCRQDSTVTSCPNPMNVVIAEGVGLVCNSVSTKIEDVGFKIRDKFPGYRCKYRLDDPWFATKPVSPWATSPDQGLYWPGLGPGAEGPYVLDVTTQVDPPRQACVASIGGSGCQTHFEGVLDYGRSTGDPRTGAHCGSSHGFGPFRWIAADGSVRMIGSIGWNQSAATILPLEGIIDRHENNKGVAFPSQTGQKPTVTGFTSSRGVGGSGNCGVSQATTGFQVEGFYIIY